MATYRMQRLDAALLCVCLLGVAVSYYGYVVIENIKEDKNYQPMCDISELVSCSKAYTSKYGNAFGLLPKDSPFYFPNSLYGIIFYTIVASLSLFNHHWNTALMLVLAIFANVFSIYLARLLYILQTFCVICVSTYVINAFILVLTIRKLREIKRVSSKKRKTK